MTKVAVYKALRIFLTKTDMSIENNNVRVQHHMRQPLKFLSHIPIALHLFFSFVEM